MSFIPLDPMNPFLVHPTSAPLLPLTRSSHISNSQALVQDATLTVGQLAAPLFVNVDDSPDTFVLPTALEIVTTYKCGNGDILFVPVLNFSDGNVTFNPGTGGTGGKTINAYTIATSLQTSFGLFIIITSNDPAAPAYNLL